MGFQMISRILKNIHDSVKDLHKHGIVDNRTMHKFDELCLKDAKLFSKTAKKLKLRNCER